LFQGIRPIQHPFSYLFSKAIFSLKTARTLNKVIAEEQYTVLNAHLIHAEINSVLALVIHKTNCKLVFTKHGYMQRFFNKYGLDHSKLNRWQLEFQLQKFVQRFTNKNLFVSNGLANFYVRGGALSNQHRVHVIHHGLPRDFNVSTEAPKRFSAQQILIPGRLVPLKGHKMGIEAFSLAHAAFPECTLVILGDGPEMENLKQFAKSKGISSSIVFEGYAEKVNRYFNGSDLVLTPSIAEAFGLVVLESYACSIPVVAFAVPAFDENIVDGQPGFWSPLSTSN